MSTLDGESPFAERSTPRLSILHLMLWTLCSAVFLAILKAIYAIQDSPGDFVDLRRASGVFYGMIHGAELAGAIVLGRVRWRLGPPLLWQPGHWLLLIGAALTVIQLPLYLLWVVVYHDALLLAYGGSQLGAAIAYVVAARRNRETRWRALLVALALIWLLQGLSLLGHGLNFNLVTMWSVLQGGQLLLGVWLMVAASLDFKAGQRRDWLHWTGVATYLAFIGMTLFWMIANLVMQE